MPLAQANLLFSHFTNADPMDLGVGGSATYRDFSITEKEWTHVVSHKEKEKQGDGGHAPFSSGPSGSSMGIYHRPVRVTATGDSVSDGLGSRDFGGLDSKTS